MNFSKLRTFVLSVLICEAVGILGALFTVSQIPRWYLGLNKPSFSPPNFVFGPVWSVLYALMGISIALVLQKASKKDNNLSIFLFSLQLILNFFWSVIFFTGHQPLLAFLDIILLWLIILALIFRFWGSSKLASILLIPYLLWVSFASVLNFYIIILNK